MRLLQGDQEFGVFQISQTLLRGSPVPNHGGVGAG